MKLSKMSWYVEVLRVPFTGAKGPSPTPETPPPNFTLGTMQSGKYSSPGNRQTQTLHEWSFCTGGKLSQSHA